MSTNDSTTVIRGGTVIDGSGTPGISADVLISGGKIIEIGHNLVGDRVLDATGCVVAPGFIDIHTHYDAQIFWDPALTHPHPLRRADLLGPSVDTFLLPRCHDSGGRQLWFFDRPGAPRRPGTDGEHDGEGRRHGPGHPARRCAVGL